MTHHKITITDHGHLIHARITRRALGILPVTEWEAHFTCGVPDPIHRAAQAARSQLRALEAQDRKRRYREGRP